MTYEVTEVRAPAVHEVMKQLASTIEACAYSLAGSCDVGTVSQVILLGAQVDRLAKKLSEHPQAKSICIEASFLVDSTLA